MSTDRIYLSPPSLGDVERDLIAEALDSGWLAPAGPQLSAFQEEFAGRVGCTHAVAVASGTAALHLALRVLGLEAGDEVLVPTFTFCASVNPILYLGGTPVFLDSEADSWNLDPNLLKDTLRDLASVNRLPKAIIAVHVYGQPANMDAISDIGSEFEIPVIEDAAEALGATIGERRVGSMGVMGVFSFNGNKIITTSGGGMIVTNRPDLALHADKLASQAREPAAHYEHHEIGYNYRMSNILAALGRGQLQTLDQRLVSRRTIFEYYRSSLGDLDGVSFMPEAPWGYHTRWLTCLTIDPKQFGADREEIRLALEAENIESRPLWKPMHLQPVYKKYPVKGGTVAENLFRDGLCLPSGMNMKKDALDRVAGVIRGMSTSFT